jgi:hypothetical protein
MSGPGQKGEILAASKYFPLFFQQQTFEEPLRRKTFSRPGDTAGNVVPRMFVRSQNMD